MPTNRKTVFANDQIYHVFNRGVEKRPIFLSKRDYERALQTLTFYSYANLPIRFSKFLQLQEPLKLETINNIKSNNPLRVEIIVFCLMPNHFHLLLKQTEENGISRFLADLTNSYTKYFNIKNDRVGPLMQGLFKAVRIEDDNQLVHISRYIHLNPTSSFLIKPEELKTYHWSSYPEYLGLVNEQVCQKEAVLGQFNSTDLYKQFVLDQVDYARTLEQIKHLNFD